MNLNYSLQMTTSRLELIPCTLDIARAAATKNKLQLEKLLGVKVLDKWFAGEVLDFLPTYTKMLQDDIEQLGWGVWLMVHIDDSTLIGDLGFTGKPDEQGTVEMGYEVLPAYRNHGYAFEAVQALVNFAFTHPELKRIISNCSRDNIASLRIIEKLKMQYLETFDSPDYPNAPILREMRAE